MKFDFQVDERFSFGEIQILMTLQKGIVTEAEVYTDALDTEIAAKVCDALRGVRFDTADMAEALGGAGFAELSEYFRKLDL